MHKITEASIFDSSVYFREEYKSVTSSALIPPKEEYTMLAFETKDGIRDPKTGIYLPLLTLRILDNSSEFQIRMPRPLRLKLTPDLMDQLTTLHFLLSPISKAAISEEVSSPSSDKPKKIDIQLVQLVTSLSFCDASLSLSFDRVNCTSSESGDDLKASITNATILTRLGEDKKKKIVHSPTVLRI